MIIAYKHHIFEAFLEILLKSAQKPGQRMRIWERKTFQIKVNTFLMYNKEIMLTEVKLEFHTAMNY